MLLFFVLLLLHMLHVTFSIVLQDRCLLLCWFFFSRFLFEMGVDFVHTMNARTLISAKPCKGDGCLLSYTLMHRCAIEIEGFEFLVRDSRLE